MNHFCGTCGAEASAGERFCSRCGRPLEAAPPPPPPPAWQPPPPPPQYAPPPQQQYAPPPQQPYAPPPPQQGYGYAPPRPAGGRWAFQISAAAQGDQLARSLGLAKPGQPQGLIEKMLRAAFLDGDVYQRAANDPNDNQNAWLALAIPAAITSIGVYLVSFSLPGLGGIVMCIGTVLVQMLGLALAVGIMSVSSQAVVGRKLDFWRLFRPLAYAQSPGVLGFLPILGSLFGLWKLVTCLVAIREAAACEDGKAAVLLIIGAVASVAATVLLAPVILSAFRFLG